MTYSLFDRIHGACWGVVIAQHLTRPQDSPTACLAAMTQGVDWVYQFATGGDAETRTEARAIADAALADQGAQQPWEHRLATLLPLWLYAAHHPDNLNNLDLYLNCHLQSLLVSPIQSSNPVPHPLPNQEPDSRDVPDLDPGQVSRIMAQAIAHALQSSPLDLSLLDALEPVWPQPHPSTPHPLHLLHRWVTCRNSLAMVSQRLSAVMPLASAAAALLLAVYCSLSTINDPRLALLRARRSSPAPRLTTGFTAIILGANHGSTAFPTAWKTDLRLGHSLDQLAARLLAIQAGVYLPLGAIAAAEFPPAQPILATPGIFHP